VKEAQTDREESDSSVIFKEIKFNLLFLVMSDHNFVLSDQDGVLVGHMSYQLKKNYLQP